MQLPTQCQHRTLCSQAQATAQYDVGGQNSVSMRNLAIRLTCPRVRCCAGARQGKERRVRANLKAGEPVSSRGALEYFGSTGWALGCGHVASVATHDHSASPGTPRRCHTLFFSLPACISCSVSASCSHSSCVDLLSLCSCSSLTWLYPCHTRSPALDTSERAPSSCVNRARRESRQLLRFVFQRPSSLPTRGRSSSSFSAVVDRGAICQSNDCGGFSPC